jgi:DNA-binding CsgD family transcriptional regulator
MRLSKEDERQIAEIESELGKLDVGQPRSLEALVVRLRELLGASFACAHNFRSGESRIHLDQWHASADFTPPRPFQQVFKDWVEERNVDFGLYNPLRPEPGERNAAKRVPWQRENAHPFFSQMMPRAGLTGFDQARVLVCEGSSLLAWVGVMRPEPFTDRELIILRRLTPTLQRRLRTERELAGPSSLLLLDAVLDTLGAPAFVVRAGGRIEHANELGRERWAKAPRETIEQLRAALAHRADGIELTELRAPGLEGYHLAVMRTRDALEPRVEVARRRWDLTPRQADVLLRLARGDTNKRIAADLGCAERTIESHVSALFNKAQADNRASLVAKLHALGA